MRDRECRFARRLDDRLGDYPLSPALSAIHVVWLPLTITDDSISPKFALDTINYSSLTAPVNPSQVRFVATELSATCKCVQGKDDAVRKA